MESDTNMFKRKTKPRRDPSFSTNPTLLDILLILTAVRV